MSIGVPLKEYVGGKILYGIKTGLNEAFVIDTVTRKQLIKMDKRSAKIIKPLLCGRDIKRYAPFDSQKYLIFAKQGIVINDYPAVKEYLEQFHQRLRPKPKDWVSKDDKTWKGRTSGTYKWYELQTTVAYFKEFETPKIIFPDIALRMQATLDWEGMYLTNTVYMIPQDDKYLLAILNSSLSHFIFSKMNAKIRGNYLRFFSQYTERLPIYRIDKSNKADKKPHDDIVRCVDQLLKLYEEKSEVLLSARIKQIEDKIAHYEDKINETVYQLYGLTDEEIKIVEGEQT
jgi:hypothetical protein